MLSQFTWLQFFLFVGGAALLWYVYVLFVYYGSSINKAITKPREEATIAVPVARRPVARSIIQTEDFTQSTHPSNHPPKQEPEPAPALKGNGESEDEEDAPVSVPVIPVVVAEPQSDLGNDNPTDEDPIIIAETDSDMSPAVLAALSGQSYNWADSPALNMDYREPDEQGIKEITEVAVTEGTEEKSPEDSAAVPADDYATTIAQLIQPEISPEAKETVLSSLQNLTGNTSVSNLVQRSTNAARNITRAFEELQDRGQLSESQVEFKERFLKQKATASTPTDKVVDSSADGDTDSTFPEVTSPPATPDATIDGEDLNALLDSLT